MIPQQDHIIKQLQGEIEGLKKQIESMRNCFNCAEYDSMYQYLGDVSVRCNLKDESIEVPKLSDAICKHWQPKK